jgi:hypothetical protein
VVIASGLERMDSIAFDSNDRLFISAEDGTIYEVLTDGTTREVLKGGMIGPGEWLFNQILILK